MRTVLYPEGGPVSDDALPPLAAGGGIVAEADGPGPAANGVLFALGDPNCGLAAYVIDGTLSITIAVPGGSTTVTAEEQLTAGPHRIGCKFRPEPGKGVHIDAVIDGKEAATGYSDHPLPLGWQIGGTSITLGYDRGLPVSDSYSPPFPWTGKLHQVVIEANQGSQRQADAIRNALKTD